MESAATNAEALMLAFAERTGLSSARPPRRYLWTDAFAVCNFLALGQDGRAAALVAQVHAVLGRHRGDDGRSGWLSGLSDAQAAQHPTRGGLRIGKPLPERRAGAPVDDALEWERDGQYFHYLTRWMHALDQYAGRAGRPEANRWACELAQVAQHAFARGTPRRLAWKMSIDLTRPLVAAMGQHDPLDGLITYLQLQAHEAPGAGAPDLTDAIRDIAAIGADSVLVTDDPLGLGGLLADAWRLQQLPRSGHAPRPFVPALLQAAATGLDAWAHTRPLRQPIARRLAFRELGLSIGLHAVERLRTRPDPDQHAALEALSAHLPLAREIERFWLAPEHREADSWHAHEDINAVMLATSLLPAGYLDFATRR